MNQQNTMEDLYRLYEIIESLEIRCKSKQVTLLLRRAKRLVKKCLNDLNCDSDHKVFWYQVKLIADLMARFVCVVERLKELFLSCKLHFI